MIFYPDSCPTFSTALTRVVETAARPRRVMAREKRNMDSTETPDPQSGNQKLGAFRQEGSHAITTTHTSCRQAGRKAGGQVREFAICQLLLLAGGVLAQGEPSRIVSMSLAQQIGDVVLTRGETRYPGTKFALRV